jgi:hypothetical protein
MTDPLSTWVRDLASALDLDPAVVDRDLVLDLARDAAHGVARPAAPLTTFLAGLAAGRNGATEDAIEDAAAVVRWLVAERSTQ